MIVTEVPAEGLLPRKMFLSLTEGREESLIDSWMTLAVMFVMPEPENITFEGPLSLYGVTTLSCKHYHLGFIYSFSYSPMWLDCSQLKTQTRTHIFEPGHFILHACQVQILFPVGLL